MRADPHSRTERRPSGLYVTTPDGMQFLTHKANLQNVASSSTVEKEGPVVEVTTVGWWRGIVEVELAINNVGDTVVRGSVSQQMAAEWGLQNVDPQTGQFAVEVDADEVVAASSTFDVVEDESTGVGVPGAYLRSAASSAADRRLRSLEMFPVLSGDNTALAVQADDGSVVPLDDTSELSWVRQIASLRGATVDVWAVVDGQAFVTSRTAVAGVPKERQRVSSATDCWAGPLVGAWVSSQALDVLMTYRRTWSQPIPRLGLQGRYGRVDGWFHGIGDNISTRPVAGIARPRPDDGTTLFTVQSPVPPSQTVTYGHQPFGMGRVSHDDVVPIVDVVTRAWLAGRPVVLARPASQVATWERVIVQGTGDVPPLEVMPDGFRVLASASRESGWTAHARWCDLVGVTSETTWL